MTLAITFESKGFPEAETAVAAIAKRASNLRPIMRLILKEYQLIEKEQFDTDGGRGHEPWAELSEAYKARKISQGYDERILRRTGALERSLTLPYSRKGIRLAHKTGLVFGTQLVYARFQKRRIFAITLEDKLRSERMVAHYIATGEILEEPV